MTNVLRFSRLAGGLTVAALALCSLNASAQSKTTVKGEVLDMNCYMAKGAHGADHKSCAAMCLEGGAPAGLMDSKGDVYLLVQSHGNTKPYDEARKHGGEQVEVTGEVAERNGVKALVVEGVKAGA
ncbi:hypothetical protein [Compostibacter hankyongensis]|uniref:Secreted protein n=1 Tax=Compostibacter hankyongensis TaxID=1007089 RepID=A0ABP8G5T1_9BACT